MKLHQTRILSTQNSNHSHACCLFPAWEYMDFQMATPSTHGKLKSTMGMLSASFEIEIAAVYVSSRQKEANTLDMPFAFDILLADGGFLNIASFFLDSGSSERSYVLCSPCLKETKTAFYVVDLSDTYISLLTSK